MVFSVNSEPTRDPSPGDTINLPDTLQKSFRKLTGEWLRAPASSYSRSVFEQT